MLAVFSAALGVSGPLLGALIDRVGLRPVVGVLGVAHPAVLVAILAVSGSRVDVGVFVLTGLAGLTLAPVGATIRAAWAQLVPRGPLLDAANALEAVTVEVLFVVGPALVGLLTAVSTPAVAVLVTGGCLGVGSIGYATSPVMSRLSTGTRERRRRRHRGPLWRLPGIGVVLLAAALVAAAFAALEVAIPATAGSSALTAAGGAVLLALVPVGSAVGGLYYGAGRRRGRPADRYAALLWLCFLGMLPLALPLPLPVIAVALPLAGLPMAAVSAEEFGLLGTLAPDGRTNETFAWVSTMMAVGGSAGNLLSGLAVDHFGPAAGRCLAPLACVLAAVAVTSRRGSLVGVPLPVGQRAMGPAEAGHSLPIQTTTEGSVTESMVKMAE